MLTKLLMEKRSEIERRKVFFFDYLNLFLHNEEFHKDTAIEKKGIIHISESDIGSMVEYVLRKDPDEERIDAAGTALKQYIDPSLLRFSALVEIRNENPHHNQSKKKHDISWCPRWWRFWRYSL